MDLDDNLQVASWLADDGADFIHASLWDVARMTRKRPEHHPIDLLRAAVPREVAVIACGSIWSRADAEAVMARGADLIALGRSAIVNPDWARDVAQPGYEPKRPPVTRAELYERTVSPLFAGYLTRWKNFVSE
jgi:2,4-dienoyl-CoA reductase-like NADH-dependent reductase (Old Yellow Enzyme family)